ncbi:MAG: hypothetical protein AAB590_00055 [Patescibacteria group bacterium]
MRKIILTILFVVAILSVGLWSKKDPSSHVSFEMQKETIGYIYGLTNDQSLVILNKLDSMILVNIPIAIIREKLIALLPPEDLPQAYADSNVTLIYASNDEKNILLHFDYPPNRESRTQSGSIVAIHIDDAKIELAGYYEGDTIEYSEGYMNCCG